MKDDKIGLTTLFCFLVVVSVILMFVSFLLGLTILVISCGSLGLLLFVYYFLAPKNIFFTFVQEGTAKAVVRGGKFRKALIQWEGYALDVDGTVKPIKDITPPKTEEYHLLGGLRLYGFWPLEQIYKYKFEWTGLEPDGITPRPHAPEILDNIFLKQYVYFAKVEKAEDAKRLPLNVCFVLTIQIVNPYKALFKVHKWLAVTFGRITPEIRNVIAQKEYEWLIGHLEDVAGQIKKAIKGTEADNTSTNERDISTILKDDYGVDVLAVKILTIDPPDELRDATLQEFKADQNRKRIEIEAEAERTKRIKEAEGEAEAFKKKVDALGGGDKGIENFVAIEISKYIKNGDKIVIDNLRQISRLFTGGLFGKEDKK